MQHSRSFSRSRTITEGISPNSVPRGDSLGAGALVGGQESEDDQSQVRISIRTYQLNMYMLNIYRCINQAVPSSTKQYQLRNTFVNSSFP